MAHNGTTSMTLSPSSSQLLSSSITSLSASTLRQSSSQISKIYRQASTLFLTRRLPESLSTIQPVITPPEPSDEDTIVNGETEPAPISTASRTSRVKVWSLYLTLLNSIVELDAVEGKQAFGSSEWRRIVTAVRDGGVWDEVVRNGYRGREGEVDAEVVINLATLLLAHAHSQRLNQQCLEAYLAASSTPNLDIGARLNSQRSHPPKEGGILTPREFHARVKIIELYTLHVLLRNGEWDCAKEFITISGDLDDERKEAFLQALESLQEEKDVMERNQKEEARHAEEQLWRRRKEREAEEMRKAKEEEERMKRVPRIEGQKDGSEVDYGIEPANAKPTLPKGSSMKASSQRQPIAGRRAPSKPPQTLITRAGMILRNLRALFEELARSWKMNPVALLRMLTFVLGIVMLFGGRDIRDRVKLMWMKVRQTVGMGVKVSYI